MKLRGSQLILLWVLFLGSFSMCGATDNKINDWNYFKPIIIQGNCKYKAALLDEQIYRFANADLSDLRIVDGKGNFVPYFLQRGFTTEKQIKTTYASQLIANYSKKIILILILK